MLLLLALAHTPTQAQAVVFSFFPDFLGTNEPAMLVLTGAALLSLAHLGSRPRNR
jgi:hypothetical protein